MRLGIITSLSFFCLLVASVSAQTSRELRQKYGEPIDARYLVRPQITASQFYSKQLHACVIKVQSTVDRIDESGELLSPKIADEIINELAPFEKRGRYSSTYDAEWGRDGEIMSIYEHVIIRRHTIGPKRWYSYFSLEWKAARCQ